ncbi:nucleotidyltransferase family protein [Paenibacillus sp. OV219]
MGEVEADLLSLTLRRNKTLITKDIYHQKVAKWRSKWPELNVTAW